MKYFCIFILCGQIWMILSSPGEVLQMHYPSITVAAQEKGNLTAESGKDGDIHINPGQSGTVYFEGNDLLEIIKIVHSLPPVWVNHSDVGFAGTFEGGKIVDIPLQVMEPAGGSIKFSLVAGDLPPGIHIESDRQRIYGIAPDDDAQYAFTIRAVGSRGKYADAVFKMETLQLEHCLYEPCRNGATCNETNIGQGYECICSQYYGGPTCLTDCRLNEIGVSLSSKIPDAQMSAFLSHQQYNASDGRLGADGRGWCGENSNSWLQVDIGRPTKLAGVTMQGYNADYLTSSYEISYSSDGQHFQKLENGTSPISLPGISGRKFSKLPTVTVARFIRFHPHSYNSKFFPCMRVELYGCIL